MRVLRSLSTSCCGLLFLSATASALGVGAIGDSLTDEYLGGTSLTIWEMDWPARNWVQILAETRGLDFGAFEADGNVRGEPRNEGYAFNYARSAATVLEPGWSPYIAAGVRQATLLAPHVAAGDVDVVYLGLGGNDFNHRRIDGEPMSGPVFDQWQTDLLAEIFTAVSVIQAAGPVDIIVGLIPEWIFSEGRDWANPEAAVAVAQTNTLLAAQATALGLGVVDLFADSFGAQDPVAGTISVGGLTFPLDSIAALADTVPEALAAPGAPCDSQGRCATVPYAAAFSLDGVHPGTLVQGLMANEFLLVLNDLWGTNIPLLTDAELFAAAVGEPSTIAVDIDIKPGSDPNSINPMSHRLIPVALLGSDTFDVTDVDVTTLAFGPSGAAPAFDLTHPLVYWLSHWDVNRDGEKDLLSSYRTEQTGIAFGDTEACLMGRTLAGVPFEGCDAVSTTSGCGLGAELALLLPPLMWLWRRRGRGV